jgi:uncharacterized membrane protein
MAAIRRVTRMKYADIEKIHEAGLISPEQRQRIIEHFDLKEGGKFMAIISFLGGVLIVGGLILLIASNWQEIPHGLKIAVGLLLMLAVHWIGYRLREVRKNYPKTGEALHLVGSGLFLGNIALVGQVYHLSSRPPNAFLIWWLGIAALPWLLRSKAHHILSLLALSIWFGMEINQTDSVIFCGNDEHQILLYALLGLVYLGFGYWLRRTSFEEFSGATEKFGLLLFHTFAYPLTWGVFFDRSSSPPASFTLAFLALGLFASVGLFFGLKQIAGLTRQWKWTWGITLFSGIGLLVGSFLIPGVEHFFNNGGSWYHWIAAVFLFTFCLLQIQVGLFIRSQYMLNLGIAAIALNIIATYVVLFGSMARTGLMFMVSGVFLIIFGVWLEKKRRSLMREMKTFAV